MLTAVRSSLPAWVFVVLGDSYDLDTHSWNPDGIRVIHQQDFWYTFGMTVLCVVAFWSLLDCADVSRRLAAS